MNEKVIALMSLLILNLALYLCENMNAPVLFFILMEYVDEIQVLFHQNTMVLHVFLLNISTVANFGCLAEFIICF